MRLIKFSTIIATSFFLTSCGCKTSYMPENYIVKAEDKKLNCQEIIYAINETEFWMKNVNERCSQPHVFAKFAPCIPMVKLDAIRNEYTLSDRADYLRSLYKIKGCNFGIKLDKSSIEKQSGMIGIEKQKMKDIRDCLKNDHIDQQIITKEKIVADIPSNYSPQNKN